MRTRWARRSRARTSSPRRRPARWSPSALRRPDAAGAVDHEMQRIVPPLAVDRGLHVVRRTVVAVPDDAARPGLRAVEPAVGRERETAGSDGLAAGRRSGAGGVVVPPELVLRSVAEQERATVPDRAVELARERAARRRRHVPARAHERVAGGAPRARRRTRYTEVCAVTNSVLRSSSPQARLLGFSGTPIRPVTTPRASSSVTDCALVHHTFPSRSHLIALPVFS